MFGINNIRNSVFNKILLSSVIPIIILFITSVSVLIYQSFKIKEENINTYTNKLGHNIDMIGKNICEVINSTDFLSFNENLFTVMTTRQETESISDTHTIKNILTEYKNSNDVIESAGVYFCEQGYIVTNTGRRTIENYLSTEFPECNYDMLNFLEEELPISGYRILGPTKKGGGNDNYVIPIVIGVAKSVKSVNLLIVNINCSELIGYLSDNANEDGTIFILTEKTTQSDYISAGISLDADTKGNIISKIIAGEMFEEKIGNKEYIGISSDDYNGVTNNFSYGIMVPVSMVLYDFYISVAIIVALMTFFMLIDVLICYYFSKKLYAPIGKMTNYLRNSEYVGGEELENEIDIIIECIRTVIEKNKQMDDKIRSNLSILQESYLYKFLRSGRLTDEDEVLDLLQKNGMSFEFDDYVVAIVRLKPTEKFYDMFIKNEYSVIVSGIDSILKVMISGDREMGNFIMHPDDEHFIVIINANGHQMESAAYKRLLKFKNMFDADTEIISVFVGIGEKHTGLDGMKKSYLEAKSAVTSMLALNESKILVYNNHRKTDAEFVYTIDDENILYNHIMNSNLAEAKEYITKIVMTNIEKGISDDGLRLLYNQFYNAVIKVLAAKEISVKSLMEEEWINPADDKSVDNEHFIDYVYVVLKKACEYVPEKNTGVDIEGMKKYIDTHFSEDIYLDKISELLGVSPKYLSRIVKEQIGINFVQYVTRVRISKATQLLKETTLSINEIMEKTGFNSRNTFVRAFKKLEGVTPSEYRNLSVKEKGSGINE